MATVVAVNSMDLSKLKSPQRYVLVDYSVPSKTADLILQSLIFN